MLITGSAAKRRQNAAQGASRGRKWEQRKPRRGERTCDAGLFNASVSLQPQLDRQHRSCCMLLRRLAAPVLAVFIASTSCGGGGALSSPLSSPPPASAHVF